MQVVDTSGRLNDRGGDAASYVRVSPELRALFRSTRLDGRPANRIGVHYQMDVGNGLAKPPVRLPETQAEAPMVSDRVEAAVPAQITTAPAPAPEENDPDMPLDLDTVSNGSVRHPPAAAFAVVCHSDLPCRSIRLRRDGKRPLTFEGETLLEAQRRLPEQAATLMFALYLTRQGAVVGSVAVQIEPSSFLAARSVYAATEIAAPPDISALVLSCDPANAFPVAQALTAPDADRDINAVVSTARSLREQLDAFVATTLAPLPKPEETQP